MKNIKKAIFFIGILQMSVISVIQAQVWNCGYPNAESVTATLRNDTLLIEGIGDMADYSDDMAVGLAKYWASVWWREHEYRNFKTVIIKAGVTKIGSHAFSYCSNIISIYIPPSVTHIGDYAFAGCVSLDSILIPRSITKIGFGAFNGTGWYEKQPDGVVYVGNVLYKYKGQMPANTTVNVREGITIIPAKTFLRQKNLVAVTIPNSVTTIEDGAFCECSSLRSLTFGNGIETIGDYAFAWCGITTPIELGNSVRNIGNYAFSSSWQIPLVVIGDSVESIGNYAFANISNITSVIIGSSVTDIGEGVFQHCDNLTSVINRNPVPQKLSKDIFRPFQYGNFYNHRKATLYVPTSSVADYKTAEIWKEFGTIVEISQ